MKKLLFIIVFVGMCTSTALADIIPPETFDFTISDTYEYGVTLNSQSLLVTGGGADGIDAFGSSYIKVQNTLPLQIDVGGIGGLNLNDNSTLSFDGGEIDVLDLHSSATAILSGGQVDYLRSYQDLGLPHIEMIVKEYDFNISTDILTGLWADDSTFSIQLLDQTGYDPVIDNITFTIVPEPATLSMMCMGILLLKKRRAS